MTAFCVVLQVLLAKLLLTVIPSTCHSEIVLEEIDIEWNIKLDSLVINVVPQKEVW